MNAETIHKHATLFLNMETTTVRFSCCLLLFMTTVHGDVITPRNADNSQPIKDSPAYEIQSVFLLPPVDDFNNFNSILIRGRNFDSSMILSFTNPGNTNGLDEDTLCTPNDLSAVAIGHPKRVIHNRNNQDDAFIEIHKSSTPLIGNELLVCVTSATHNSNKWVVFKNILLPQPFPNNTSSAERPHPKVLRSARKLWRRRRTVNSSEVVNTEPLSNHSFPFKPSNMSVELIGVSIEYDSDKKLVNYDEFGTPHILENTLVTMRLFGRFSSRTRFRFTKFDTCNDSSNKEPISKLKFGSSDKMATLVVKLPKLGELYQVFMCLGEEADDLTITWTRQGGENTPGLKIVLYQKLLPLWVHIVSISILLVLSGLFSGLNLGLMSLNKTDLKIIINTGTEQEKDHASRIAPVRKRGNFLLCCLLFSNVLVNSSLTILVDDLTSGLIAIMMSTMGIVIFGEIIPQAICSRYGLAVGARTIFITKFFMAITSPLAYPLSLILDKLLGEEIGSVYTRERLKELLKVTKDHHGLANEEVGIISGALEMKTKTVKDIMTKLENVFMLPLQAVLDFDTISEIEYHGYTRIPIYDEEKNNVVAVLNVKQLTLLDPTDAIPLKAVIEYYHSQILFVYENTHLDYMFRAFREGNRGHIAFVQKVNDEGPGDPYYETMGIVTMEDVLEELLQADIMDENDVGKMEARNINHPRRKYIPWAAHKKNKASVELPKPLTLAATQYLATSVQPFRRDYVSVPIVQRLLRTNVYLIKLPKFKYNEGQLEQYLYETDKPSEFFTMVLDGRIRVEVGREKLTYEAGSFTTFGSEFLLKEAERDADAGNCEDPNQKRIFYPDYSVKIMTDVQYLRLNYSSYKAARLATELERTYCDPEKAAANKNWEDEIEKVLQAGGDLDQSGQNPESFERIECHFPTLPPATILPSENGDQPTEETKLL